MGWGGGGGTGLDTDAALTLLEGRERPFCVCFAYLCKQVETAQFADNTVHLGQPLPFTAGLKDTRTQFHIRQEANAQDTANKTLGLRGGR